MTDWNDGNQVDLAPGVRVPDSVLTFTFSRSGGPGGQHVNKTSTQATLTVALADLVAYLRPATLDRLRKIAGNRLASDPPRLVISSSESRSQRRNREACYEKLRDMLIRAMARPRPRKPTRPSRRAVQRRIDQKKQRGQLKRSRRNDRRPPRD